MEINQPEQVIRTAEAESTDPENIVIKVEPIDYYAESSESEEANSGDDRVLINVKLEELGDNGACGSIDKATPGGGVEIIIPSDQVADLINAGSGNNLIRDLEIDNGESTGNKDFVCPICYKHFISKGNLKSHVKLHSGHRPFQCPDCSATFNRRSILEGHVRCVHGSDEDRPFVCDICGFSFKLKSHLNSHVTTHSDVTPHSCQICGKKFRQKQSLNIHVRTHEDGKFSCDICGKEFKVKRNLDAHVRIIHVKGGANKSHECEECGKMFTRPNHLRTHLKLIHNGEKPVSCTLCDQKFTRNNHLKRHLLSHHSTADQDGESSRR